MYIFWQACAVLQGKCGQGEDKYNAPGVIVSRDLHSRWCWSR
jgi:hypothetical protein